MAELRTEIRELADRYPERKSALLPALRLAQERYGHLPPEALREVASALGTTPAYCRGIASFYDMFHLAPVGEHIIDVCTNASCALVGAAQVLEAFERELGIAAGENTDDMLYTIEEVHCVGACGMAPVVMINDRAFGKLTPDKAVKVVKEFQVSVQAAEQGNGNNGAGGEDEK